MSCACCGHATNSHQHGLCSGCEDLLAAISGLPKKTKMHVLARGTGATAAEIMQTLGCGYSTNGSMVQSARKIVGATVDRLVQVARYGMATNRLAVPRGFSQPTHETPSFEPPAPRTLERIVIDTPAPRPVVTEHREPETKAPEAEPEAPISETELPVDETPEPVRMLTDRDEDAPLPRAVTAINRAAKEELLDTGDMPEHASEAVMTRAVDDLLERRRHEAKNAALAYQDAFAGLAHLALTGEGLPDLSLVRLGFELGRAKGAVEALEAIA